MRLQTLLLCLLGLCAFNALAADSQAINIENGEGYEIIDPPQPTDDSSKVEVIEFFWYGCPHCYRFEPVLQKWLETKPDYVNYIPQPAAFSSIWAKHARAFYTAEALGVLDKMHKDFFDAIQVDKKRLDKEDVLAEFFVEHGIDKKDFNDTYNSFLVDAKTKQTEAIPGRYGVTGVPAVVVNGKYRISGSTAKNYENMIKVMDYLITKEYAAINAAKPTQ